MEDFVSEKASRRAGLAWKKCYCEDGNEVLVLLGLTKDDPLAVPNGEYLIAKETTVLGIYDMWGWLTSITETRSWHDRSFVYRVGETLAPENGIWCWPTFAEALRYWVNQGANKDERYAELAKEEYR